MDNNLIPIALALLQDEADGNVAGAHEKMDLEHYSMTWMYRSGETLFPSVEGRAVAAEVQDIYQIKGREYEIVNTAQNGNAVFIEMVESYPDAESGQEYRTPITLVLEFDGAKVVRGRHYTDPRLSHEFLSKDVIHAALGRTPEKIIKAD